MGKNFEIQIAFQIVFNDEGLVFDCSITEPEYIVLEDKFRDLLDSIGGIKVWNKEINRIKQIWKRKDVSKIINLVCKDQEFIYKKQSKQFKLLFKNTDTDIEIDEMLDKFFKYIVENLNETTTLH
jgi:hypothetical protein